MYVLWWEVQHGAELLRMGSLCPLSLYDVLGLILRALDVSVGVFLLARLSVKTQNT